MTADDVITGADIARSLLRGSAELTEVVPAASIRGRISADTPLPALVVKVVSSVDRSTLKRGQTVRRNDRVSVAVRAATAGERKLIIRLIRRACAHKTGEIAGAASVTVLLDGTGPELDGPADSYFEQTQDLRVSFDEPA